VLAAGCGGVDPGSAGARAQRRGAATHTSAAETELPQPVEIAPTGVELSLYAVTDDSGTAGTAAPGAVFSVFSQGEKVRLTLSAASTGTAITPWVVVNVWSPSGARVLDASMRGSAELGQDGTQYYSFDWTVPDDAIPGPYSVSASIRDAGDFATLYDTLAPGPTTGWGSNDIVWNAFFVAADQCTMAHGGCAAIAACASSHGTTSCTCPAGYAGDGTTCADVDECAEDNGGCGPTGQCVNTPGSWACYDNGPGVQLTLHAVTDPSGAPDTSTPGAARTSFAPGSTVRLTLKLYNTGPPVTARVVLTAISPSPGASLVLAGTKVGAAPLDTGATQYFSFDWQVPAGARLGSYAVAASARSASDFTTLYDTLVPGANTGWGTTDTLSGAFQLVSGIGLALYQVTDASGQRDSASPGVAQRSFGPGDTVRMTLRATNTGPTAGVVARMRMVRGDGTVAYEATGAPAVLPAGGTGFYSFDWTVPRDAAQGTYALDASLLDASNPDHVLDAIGPAPGAVAIAFRVVGGVELTLFAITDTGGTAGTANPGTVRDGFAPGETVRITLKAYNSGPPVSPWPFLNVWSPNGSLAFTGVTEALPPLPSFGTQYYSYDWTVPWEAAEGAYAVSASIRQLSSFTTLLDTLTPGPDTGWGTGDTRYGVLTVSRGVSLTLYSVTDDSGTPDTSTPGLSSPAPSGAPAFAPGDRVRITLRLQNSGPPIAPRVVLNLWAPRGTIGRVLDASRKGPLLASGETRYLSFDWTVPPQTPLGAYAVSASARDAAVFSTVFDTLVAGPNTGFGAGDVSADAFEVARLARLAIPRGATGVTSLAWSGTPAGGTWRLTIGRRPGATDVLDTGPTSVTTIALPALPGGPLWAQIWTASERGWISSGPVLFTTEPSWSAPQLTLPQREDGEFDAAKPLEWTPATLAYSYRLAVGTAPGAADLADSGPIQVLRRFLPPLPHGVPLYGRLESALPDRLDVQDFTFQLPDDAAAPTAATQLENARWATAHVRSMAGRDNVPAPYTPLEAEIRRLRLPAAFCSQYAATLLVVLDQMNLTIPSRRLTIGFNPNFFEMHDLDEVYDPDTGRWLVLDALFGVAPRRAADGAWATAEEIQAATTAKQWLDIDYHALHPLAPAVLSGYYLDYPLLFLNVWHRGDEVVWGSGRPVVPFLAPATLTGTSARWLTVQASAAVSLRVDGGARVLTPDGVESTSRVFKARDVTPESGAFTLYEVPRYRFPYAP
jgi:hypothetical protein